MITILSGSNSFGLRAELRRLVAAFTDAYDAAALERLDGEDAGFGRMRESLQSLPFLTERKLVVLEQPAIDKEFAEQAAGLLAGLPETTDLIIVEPKPDKRSAYYKLLKKQPGFQDFSELDAGGLARWLVGRSSGALRPADARYLVERVGSDQQRLSSELDKLLLTGRPLNKELIDDMTAATPQSTVFQLLEAAFAGNLKKALALYAEQRALKVDSQQIVAMLGWQLHILALIKAAGPDHGSDAVAREAGISPYVVKKSTGIARGLSMARLKELIEELAGADERLKSQSVDDDEVLMDYLVRLSV